MSRIAWLAGLIVFVSGREYLEENVLWKISSEQVALRSWIVFLIPFITGVYLSLLFLEGKVKKFDQPLFFMVLLPTLFFAILPIFIRTLTIENVPYEITWLSMKLNAGNLLPLVAGLSFLPAVIGKGKHRK